MIAAMAFASARELLRPGDSMANSATAAVTNGARCNPGIQHRHAAMAPDVKALRALRLLTHQRLRAP